MINETNARTDLTEAQKTEINTKLQNIMGYFSIKPDKTNVSETPAKAPQPQVKQQSKLTEGTVTSKSGKSYRVRKDANGNVVGVFNPTTNQWETK
jgi:hypothetical protein